MSKNFPIYGIFLSVDGISLLTILLTLKAILVSLSDITNIYAVCCQSIPLDPGWLEWILVGWQHADGLSQMSDESLHPLQYNK